VIGRFLRELKRRRVLNTAFLYVVGAWIALQVVEVLAGAGLPPTAMRNLLIILSFGFPLALITGWFFDISTDGIKKTGPLKEGEQLPKLKFLDHVFLAGLVFIVAMDAYILSFPPPEDIQVVSTASQQRTIAVLSFDDLELAQGSDPIGEVLAGELRSSLTRTAGLRVLGPATSKMLRKSGDDPYAMAEELLVTALVLGEVLLDGRRIRIQTRLVSVPDGNEIWSTIVEGPVGDAVRRCSKAWSGRLSERWLRILTLTRYTAPGPRRVSAATFTIFICAVNSSREAWKTANVVLNYCVKQSPSTTSAPLPGRPSHWHL